MPLPSAIGPTFLRAQIYDAGTELNTEKSLDLPDACGAQLGAQRFPEDGSGHEATSDVIAVHPGLHLQGDLTDVSAWNGPVLEVKLERIGPESQLVSNTIVPPTIPRSPQFTPPGNGPITTSSQDGFSDF